MQEGQTELDAEEKDGDIEEGIEVDNVMGQHDGLDINTEENQTRRSTRLMGQTMKIADKAEELTRKRNLEGTNLSSKNSFAVLSDKDIIDKSVNMGVKTDINMMQTVNVIRDLEIARHTLDQKRMQEEK